VLSFGARENLSHEILPSRSDPAIAQRTPDGFRHQPSSTTGYRARRLSENYRPLIQGFPAPVSRGHHRQPPLPRSVPVENASSLRCRQGEGEDGQYELSITWRMLLRSIRDDNGSPSRVARDRLDEICRNTEAYIATPDENTTRILIWGTEEQVARARSALEYFEKDIRALGVRPSREHWVKMQALDGRAEHRLERQSKLREVNDLFRAAGAEVEFEYEAYLLLSRDLDLEQFAGDHDAKVLDEIRNNYLCRIDFQTTDIPSVQISAQSEHDILKIYVRVVNLFKEMLARQAQLVRVNLFHLPIVQTYQDRVRLDQDPTTNLYLPTLDGKPLPAEEQGEWNALCRRVHVQNRRTIRSCIDSCFKSLSFSQRHVRMRVIFGELGFSQFLRPMNGEESHTFDEFCDMVTKDRTRLQQYALRSPDRDISQLGDILAALDAFGEHHQEAYAVLFDFQGETPNTVLRLETEFNPGIDGKELEICGQRWLEFKKGDEDSRLQVSMLDFERPDYQMRIDAVRLFQNKQAQKDMASFQANLGFKAAPNGIKSYPRRRAIFPPGHASLRRVSEITIVRYHFKGTDGLFELRREDVYEEGNPSATPVKSDWTAAYYYPEWDNLLSQFGYIRPGENVDWVKSIATFFPDSRDADDSRSLPKGLKVFMQEVEQIQDLLSIAMADLPRLPQHSRPASSRASSLP